jgi:hypothetical protein
VRDAGLTLKKSSAVRVSRGRHHEVKLHAAERWELAAHGRANANINTNTRAVRR